MQVALYKLAQTYGIFAPKTKAKIIKAPLLSNSLDAWVTLAAGLQEWARLTASEARSLCVHGLKLASRSVSSRWEWENIDVEITYTACRRKKIQVLKKVISKVISGKYICFEMQLFGPQVDKLLAKHSCECQNDIHRLRIWRQSLQIKRSKLWLTRFSNLDLCVLYGVSNSCFAEKIVYQKNKHTGLGACSLRQPH